MTMTSLWFGMVVRIGAFPKTKSGPGALLQLGLLEPTRHPVTQTSLGVAWRTHLILPVARSKAITASLVGGCGSAKAWPVDAYTTFRFASMAGDDQIPTPAGPYRVSPSGFLPCGFAASGSV